MIGKYAAVAAIGALCIAGQASAKDAAMAQLSAVKGSVMVNQGGKMVPATAGALRTGRWEAPAATTWHARAFF